MELKEFMEYYIVTILILIDGFLQCDNMNNIGIKLNKSQSLF